MKKKVALIHDWLLHYRGGEKVLEALCELYPEADIYTLFYQPGRVCPTIERHRIIPSFLNRLPGAHKYYRYFLPLFPLAVERWNLQDYDVVISSSHCVAKGVLPPPHAFHLSYVYTPMRYAWDKYAEYFGGKLWEPLAYLVLHYLRMWDAASSARVDHFMADSHLAARRIGLYYRRDAEVIPAFVDTEAFRPTGVKPTADYYLVASALVPYKRVDLAIQACALLNKRLVIVGEGPEEAYLRSLAGPNVTFAGRVPFEQLRGAYENCKALLFPGEEDFGIVPLEAMAMGRPVIGYGRGGILDTVVDGETGILYPEATAKGLAEAIVEFEAGPEFSPAACIARAHEFSRDKFKARFREGFETALGRHLAPAPLPRSPYREESRPAIRPDLNQ